MITKLPPARTEILRYTALVDFPGEVVSFIPTRHGDWMRSEDVDGLLKKMEILAKSWLMEAGNPNYIHAFKAKTCADELLKLIATLEPGAADVETPGEMK